MKKILLIICILSLNFSAFSQEYNCAISDSDFEGIKAAMNDMPFETDKTKNSLDLIKRTQCCFTSRQIYELAEGFSFEDNMLTFLKGVYDNILDDQSADFYKILSLFKFESNKTAFSSFISSHRSKCSEFDIRRHHNPQHQKHEEHYEHKDKSMHYDNDDKMNHTDMNNANINVNANFDENNMNMSVNGQNNTPNTNISININVPNQSSELNNIHIEWLEPKDKVVATENEIKRIKAKVYCSALPEISLIIDKNRIAQEPIKVIPLENKGFIVVYDVNLHKGENHISFRAINPSNNSYISSEERIIELER